MNDPINLPDWLAEYGPTLKPPVGNREMFPGRDDFVVMVVGGPNQRTDYHVDPYEEVFYQLKGTMHVNVQAPDGPARVDIGEGDMWVLPRNMPHSPQRPEPGSIGLVFERVREPGTLERFRWYCNDCNAVVHDVELQVRDIVADLPPVFEAFYSSEEARTCPNCAGNCASRTGMNESSNPSADASDRAPAPAVAERNHERTPLRRQQVAWPGNAVIDVHTHLVPKGWPDLRVECGGDDWPWLRIDSEREAMLMVGELEFRAVGSPCWDADHRLADMDADGVDLQVVSPTPVFFSYERPVAQAIKVARIFNDLALECSTHDRLVPFCQVPLQDADAACTELDRCLAAGHASVEIGNHVGDQDLDDPRIVEFLRHCATVGAPVLVHPWDMPTGPRVDRWMARWLAGMPAETHLSLLSMILGGVFDEVPPTLRMCFAHGGGSFAFWLGRMDNAWHRRGDVVRGRSQHPPSHYVDRFFVDSVVFDHAPLRLLVDTLGEDQVMVGSDYPYPLGERPAGAVVRTADFLTDAQRDKLLSRNALRFLGRDG